jgi:hypothetical protein
MAKFIKATVDDANEETCIIVDHITRLMQCKDCTVVHFENDKSVEPAFCPEKIGARFYSRRAVSA